MVGQRYPSLSRFVSLWYDIIRNKDVVGFSVCVCMHVCLSVNVQVSTHTSLRLLV